MRLLHLLPVIGLVCPFAVAVGGCMKMSAKLESEPGQAAGEGKGRGPEGKKQDAPATPRKIIYTASVRLIVEDFAKAGEGLELLVEQFQGLIVHRSGHGAPGSPRSGQWKVRVPVAKFKEFQAAVIKLGELQTSSLDSQDVTEEFYDLQTRIKHREARLAQLREMYKKAEKVADMVPIDKEIDEVQLTIEREQGRLRVLTTLTEMTTVTVTLQERGAYVPPEAATFGTRAGRTFSDSLGALADFGQGLVLFLVALVPWLPVVAVIALPLWLGLRRRRPAVPAGELALAEPPASPPPANPTP